MFGLVWAWCGPKTMTDVVCRKLEEQLRELREAKEELEEQQGELQKMMTQLEEAKNLEAEERRRQEEEIKVFLRIFWNIQKLNFFLRPRRRRSSRSEPWWRPRRGKERGDQGGEVCGESSPHSWTVDSQGEQEGDGGGV